MSVKDRIEDSILLFHAGRLEGALISVLLAVAATSRKRYPTTTIMGDKAAFEQFLKDERAKIVGGKEVCIDFGGETLTLESILYKFVRNRLIHEAELDTHVSFEYGDFLLDKRGTTDQFTFSSELVVRLAFAVETAPENEGLYPQGRYDRLPEPVALKRLAIVKYSYGDQHFELFCWACSVQREAWEETGEETTWLHLNGRQAYGGRMTDMPGVTLLVPTKYITSIEAGPAFKQTRKRTSANVGVFSPDKPPPDGTMSLPDIERVLAELQIPLVATTITVHRPHYEIAGSVPDLSVELDKHAPPGSEAC
jgi:hypothetical protein